MAIYNEKRLLELSGIREDAEVLTEDREDRVERQRGRIERSIEKRGRAPRRAFVTQMDDQEAAMNIVGKALDKLDFLNVLDKIIGMPRFGFKKGHAVPFDAVARPDLNKMPDEVYETELGQMLLDAPAGDIASDAVYTVLDGVARGDQASISQFKGGLAIARSLRLTGGKSSDIIGHVEIPEDKKYIYYILKGGEKFLAGSKKTKKVLSMNPYPIKLGSPVATAAKAMNTTGLVDDEAAFKAALDGALKSGLTSPQIEGLGLFKKAEISGDSVQWVMDYYGDTQLQKLINFAQGKELGRQVGDSKMSAAIYLADMIAYVNGKSRSDGEVKGELFVPDVDDVASEVKSLQEALTSRRIKLINLVTEVSADFETFLKDLAGKPEIEQADPTLARMIASVKDAEEASDEKPEESEDEAAVEEDRSKLEHKGIIFTADIAADGADSYVAEGVFEFISNVAETTFDGSLVKIIVKDKTENNIILFYDDGPNEDYELTLTSTEIKETPELPGSFKSSSAIIKNATIPSGVSITEFTFDKIDNDGAPSSASNPTSAPAGGGPAQDDPPGQEDTVEEFVEDIDSPPPAPDTPELNTLVGEKVVYKGIVFELEDTGGVKQFSAYGTFTLTNAAGETEEVNEIVVFNRDDNNIRLRASERASETYTSSDNDEATLGPANETGVSLSLFTFDLIDEEGEGVEPVNPLSTPGEDPSESIQGREDTVLSERWQRMAGLLK